MERLFGIPAHPLMVHLPIVLAPVVCLAAVAIAVRPPWLARFGRLVLWGAVVSFIATVFATQSGDGLVSLDPDLFKKISEKHAELGETTRMFAFLLAISVAVLVIVSRKIRANSGTVAGALPLARTAATVATVVFALLNTVWMIRTGHEGARIVWEQVGK